MTTLNKQRLKKQTQQRNRVFLCIGAVLLLLLPIITYIIHQVLTLTASGIFDFSQMDYNYFAALKLLITDKSVQQIGIGVFLLCVGFLLYLAISAKQVIGTVDEIQITDDIRIPVPAGNGQHGKERFLTEREKKKLYREYVINKDAEELPPLTERPGVVVEFEEDDKKQIYRYIPGDKHSIILAITDSGKTRRIIMQTIGLQVLYGLSVICSDVKGELFYFTSPFAKKRGYEVIDIDFRTPNAGKRYNFLQPILNALKEGDEAKAINYTWDLVSVLVGEPKGEAIWTNGESASIASSILAVAMEAPESCRNMTNVYYFIAYMCKPGEYGKLPLERYLERFPYDHPCRAVFAMAEMAPHKTRSSFFSMALGTLRLFTDPGIASMTSCSDFDLKDISRKKTIMYMICPDEKETFYPIISLMVTQAYMLQVEVANENGLRLPVETDYNLDEVGNFPKIPVLPNMITAGRGRGVRVNLVIQEYEQLKSKYKDDAKTIKGNCEIKVCLKVDDKDTLKEISDYLGPYTVEVGSASVSTSDNAKDRTNYSNSSSLTGRPLLYPAEIKRLKTPYALVMKTGEYSSVNILPDISETAFNKAFGMGDREFNQQLIMQREAERTKRATVKIPLWGIWEQFSTEEEEGEEAPTDMNQNQKKRVSFLD